MRDVVGGQTVGVANLGIDVGTGEGLRVCWRNRKKRSKRKSEGDKSRKCFRVEVHLGFYG